MNIRCYLKLSLVLLLTGCMLQAEDSNISSHPALVGAQSEASITELQQLIASLLNVEQVTITPEAFTKSSKLTLERKQHLDNNGQLLMGRTLTMPQEVLLLLQDTLCFLQDAQGNQSPPLKQTPCVLNR